MVAALAGLSISLQAADETMLKLLKLLRDRGSITEAEYQELLKVGGAPIPQPGTNAPASIMEQRLSNSEAEVKRLQSDLEKQKADVAGLKEMKEFKEGSSSAMVAKALKDKWYQKMSFGGYTQLRYSRVLDSKGPAFDVPSDRSVRDADTFFIRRGRLKLSGDVTEHLYLYAQTDFNGSVGGAGSFGLQMRDLYADIAVDPEKEFRFRVGQSKVPFGWVNMQSSQNRAPMERPDGINSAAEGERDIGAFFMWAPAEARERFKTLVKDGLKGSGDYGVLALGAYSGQGPNLSDANGDPHWVARVTYPFKLNNGQFFELGANAYYGHFVSNVSPIGVPAAAPSMSPDGVADWRTGITAVWYPQPFGVEAEWMMGRGPTLNTAFNNISSEFLHGGYVQLNYRKDTSLGEFFPFARWNYYDGGRKFGTNAPDSLVNELDFGLEWSPWKEVELALMYTRTFSRTNTRVFPYTEVNDVSRIGLQVQVNY